MGAIRWVRRGIALAGIGAVGGALFVTARHLLETPQPLQSALLGEGRIDRKHGGDIYYNVAGDESAEPVVLLHDFYPGASNYEYRHIFPHLAAAWRVYAPDWLGFGMSEHPSLAYTGEFYANMLIGFLRDVVGRPAVVLGHGRAANIAVRAASDAPDLFTRLILVAPDVEAGIELEPKPTQLLTRATQRISLGLVPYAFLSTKPLLRRLAHRRSALSGETSAGEDTVAHLYASAHQFGGQHALLALMAGELDLPIQNAFPLLRPPVLIISGDEDPRRPVEMMEELAILNPHADLDVLTSAGEAVFEDQPTMFAEALLDWLATSKQPQVEQPLEQMLEEQAEEIAVLTEETETVIILEAPETTETTDTSESVPGSTATPTEPAVDQPPEQTEARLRSAPTTRPARRTASTSLSAPIDEPPAEDSTARRPQRSTRQARQSATTRPRSQKADKAEQSGKSEAVSKPRTTKKATGGASSGKSTDKTSNAGGQKSGARNANGTTSPEKTSDNKRSRASSRAARKANPNTD
jgi:pimeloyl-ACP methyl ester carboxylesterase